ncbi:MAG: 50S ribosomal protein L25 [Patescibacteria group bacterium]
MLTLEVKTRKIGENLAALRKDGFMPAVFYGRKEKSTPVSVSLKAFEKALKQAGESTVITLTGDAGEHDALIHEVSKDSLTGVIQHADFYIIEKGKKLRVSVPVEFAGIAPAVKELGGILVKVLHEIEIEAMPKDLPHGLTCDISAIVDFHTHVTAGQIVLPLGVELITDAEEIVAMVAAPKEEKEEEAVAFDPNAVEVEKKGKEANPDEDAAVPEKGAQTKE